jgi:hypothetical protein
MNRVRKLFMEKNNKIKNEKMQKYNRVFINSIFYIINN